MVLNLTKFAEVFDEFRLTLKRIYLIHGQSWNSRNL